jgi:phenylpropionate dioxygenase-like ring-hydroxylating dioxygenase large terminal subunit
MTAAPWHNMFLRLLDEYDSRGSPRWHQGEARLQASVYHGPRRYEAELARVFRRLPLCLGHFGQLPEPGSMLAQEIAGYPLLPIRDTSNSIGLYLNACRHRGARLLYQDGIVCRQSSLTCRYHGRTYDLNGRLAALPRWEAFPSLDRDARGLRRLPCAVKSRANLGAAGPGIQQGTRHWQLPWCPG